jgi:hypothetical protein
MLAKFQDLACTDCKRLTYHATQYSKLREL